MIIIDLCIICNNNKKKRREILKTKTMCILLPSYSSVFILMGGGERGCLNCLSYRIIYA